MYCLIYRSFKKQTQVVRDLRLKQHLLEQAMRPDPVLRPSLGRRSPLCLESASASLSKKGISEEAQESFCIIGTKEEVA